MHFGSGAPLQRPSITKWNIFHYVYAVLHHPDYRQRYAPNLRPELPRIPFLGTARAEAQTSGDADAALKRRSSTEPSTTKPSTEGAPTKNESIPADGAAVVERPFRAASQDDEKRNSSTLPKAVAAERGSQATQVFHAFVGAGRRLAEIRVQ
jgi:hypothetical protein